MMSMMTITDMSIIMSIKMSMTKTDDYDDEYDNTVSDMSMMMMDEYDNNGYLCGGLLVWHLIPG